MIEDFKPALAKTLIYEGLWADNPKDPGGATMKGITLNTFRRYVPGASKSDLRNISEAMVEHIYKEGFWDTIGGDKLPSGVSAVVFDFGVNSGPARGLRALKVAQGFYPGDAAKQVNSICDQRMSFLRSLGTFSTFGSGWTRRVTDLRAFGLRSAVSRAPAPKAIPQKEAPAVAPPISAPITPIAPRPSIWTALLGLFHRK